MQAELAEQRAAEAALEKQRVFHGEQTDRVAAVQGRYYEIGAQISRTEQSIQHTRELRERQRTDLAAARGTQNDLALHIERDERELAVLRAELSELSPKLTLAANAEEERARALAEAEGSLQRWQARWEEFNRALGAAHQTTQVERARIEQACQALEAAAAGEDATLIHSRFEAVDDATKAFAGRRMNRAIARAIEGRAVDTVEKSVEHAKGVEEAHAR